MAIMQTPEWLDWTEVFEGKMFEGKRSTRSEYERNYLGTFDIQPAGLLASKGPIRVEVPVNPFELRDPSYVRHMQGDQAEMLRRELEKTTPACVGCDQMRIDTERQIDKLALRETVILAAKCSLRSCAKSKMVSNSAPPADRWIADGNFHLPDISPDIPESVSEDAW